MDKILTWLDPRIPIEYITVSFLILCLAILMGFAVLKGRWIKRFVLISIAAEYYFLVLCTTVICRTKQALRTLSRDHSGTTVTYGTRPTTHKT